MAKFKIKVQRTITQTAWVTVEALNDLEATDKATEIADDAKEGFWSASEPEINIIPTDGVQVS